LPKGFEQSMISYSDNYIKEPNLTAYATSIAVVADIAQPAPQ
jgi:hypothetical protein